MSRCVILNPGRLTADHIYLVAGVALGGQRNDRLIVSYANRSNCTNDDGGSGGSTDHGHSATVGMRPILS